MFYSQNTFLDIWNIYLFRGSMQNLGKALFWVSDPRELVTGGFCKLYIQVVKVIPDFSLSPASECLVDYENLAGAGILMVPTYLTLNQAGL